MEIRHDNYNYTRHGPEIFQIQLQGSGIHYGGQKIHGQVKVGGSKMFGEYLSNVKGINIEIRGFGYVHWEGMGDPPKTFQDYEDYLCNNFVR